MGLGAGFWRLLLSSGISNLADGIAFVAAPLLAASLTRDPFQISLIEATAFLPWLLFAVPGGALVDRMDRRWAMTAANICRALAYLGLALLVVAGAVTMLLIYLTGFVLGFVEVIYDSSARALVPQVIGKESLDSGNSFLTITESTVQQFVGAPVGAALFAAAAASPFFSAAGCYAVGAITIAMVKGRFRPERTVTTTLRADVVEGLVWLWQHRFLRGLTLLAGWFTLMLTMTNAIFVLYALEHLGLTNRQVGLLVVAIAVGGVLGGLAAPRLSAAFGRERCLVGSTVVSPLAVLLMGLTHSPVAAGALFAVSAAAVTVWNVLSMSIRQAMIPEALFGRILGGYRMVIWGLIPLGAVLGGLLAAWTSIGTVFVLSGALSLPAAWLIATLMHAHRDEIRAAYQASTSSVA
jgi:MFS family permease